jgi:hypothetical protein
MISGPEVVWMLWKREKSFLLLGFEPYILGIKPGA